MAITNQFVVPPTPMATEVKHVYPWEHTDLMILCSRLYEFAASTGYTGTLSEFKVGFGAYLEANQIITKEDFERYTGQYDVIPLPLVQQILNTKDTVLEDNIIIEPIPFQTVTNLAGGYTVNIG